MDEVLYTCDCGKVWEIEVAGTRSISQRRVKRLVNRERVDVLGLRSLTERVYEKYLAKAGIKRRKNMTYGEERALTFELLGMFDRHRRKEK